MFVKYLPCTFFPIVVTGGGIQIQCFLWNCWNYVIELYILLSFDTKRLLFVSLTLVTCVSCEIVQRFVVVNINVFLHDLSCCSQGRLMSKWNFLLWLIANGCMNGVSHPKIVAGLVVALWLSVSPNACTCSVLCQTTCLHSPLFSRVCLLSTFKCA